MTSLFMATFVSWDQRSYIEVECQGNKTAKKIFSALHEV